MILPVTDDEMDRVMRDSIKRYAGALSRLGYGPTNKKWPCPHPKAERRYDTRVQREWCHQCCHWMTP